MSAPSHWPIASATPERSSSGPYSPVPAGDYATGGNHVLPTGGWAKSTGGLGLEAFMKTVTVQRVTKEGLERLAPTIEALADLEDMPAHKATARR